jgi:hypothetical protein
MTCDSNECSALMVEVGRRGGHPSCAQHGYEQVRKKMK